MWVASAVRCRGVRSSTDQERTRNQGLRLVDCRRAGQRSSTDQLGGWGVRGEGVGGGVQKKRQEQGEAAGKPVTIVLLDDRKQDAYGNCQVATPPASCRRAQQVPARRRPRAQPGSQSRMLVTGALAGRVEGPRSGHG